MILFSILFVLLMVFIAGVSIYLSHATRLSYERSRTHYLHRRGGAP